MGEGFTQTDETSTKSRKTAARTGKEFCHTRLDSQVGTARRNSKRLQLLRSMSASGVPGCLFRKWREPCIFEGNEKVKLNSQPTCGQLLTGTHCFLRHSVLPFTQAQMLQLTEDHISPSCGTQHRILLSGGDRRN